MELTLKRTTLTNSSTIGELAIDGVYECKTLEDVVREVEGQPVSEWKVPGQTAIPRGRYQVVLDWSNRFGRTMPHLLSVPGFDGVRIHWGNTDEDTEGCILVGRTQSENFIGESRLAFEALFEKLEAAAVGSRYITIT